MGIQRTWWVETDVTAGQRHANKFNGEAVAIGVEHSTNVRRVYDIDAKRQHRQYYEQESDTWITTASKDIRLVYVAAP